MNSFNTNSVINVNSVKVRMASLTFESSRRSKSETSPVNVPNSVIEIVNPYNLSEINIKEGEHRNVKATIGLSKSNPENGIEILGDYKGTPVQIFVYENLNIVANGRDFDVNESQQKTISIKLNIHKLLENITSAELDNAVVSSGTIVIAMDPNLNLYSKIKANLNAATEIAVE